MKIITRAVWQMTPAGYELLEQDAYDHAGQVQHAKGGGPAAPDPARQAAAESAANRPNVVGPGGTTTYSQGPRIVTGYDAKGNPIFGNRDTETTTLSDSGQKQFDLENQIAESLLGGARGQVDELANTKYQNRRTTQGDFDPGGEYTQGDQYTPNGKFADDVYERTANALRPEFDRRNRANDQKLANQGLPIGSEAYKEAQSIEGESQNKAFEDAALAAEEQGFQRDLAVRGQQQDELSGRFGRNLNIRQQQQSEVDQANQQGLSERQQQYNELAAALGGDQIAPIGAFGPGGGASPIDVSGAFGAQQDSRLARYNASQQQRNTNIGAGAGLATAGIIAF